MRDLWLINGAGTSGDAVEVTNLWRRDADDAEICLLAIALALGGLAACNGGSPPTHYFASGDNWAIYLAWTEDTSGHLQGQLQAIEVDPNDSAKLQTVNGSFTGTRNGQDISISFPVLSNYAGQTWTGTINNGTISLVIPTSGLPQNPALQAGSFQDFQRAAQKVQEKVNVAAQEQAREAAFAQQQREAATAAAEAQNEHNRAVSAAYGNTNDAANRLKDAYSQVHSALAQLAAGIPATPGPDAISTRYVQTYGKMKQVWQKENELGDAEPLTCYQRGQVQYLAGQVQYLRGQVQYLDGQVQYNVNRLQQVFDAANNGLDAIDKWAPAFYQHAQIYSNLTGKPNTIPEPTRAIETFRSQTEGSLAVYNERLENFRSLVKDYDDKAAALQEQAKAYPASLHCSG